MVSLRVATAPAPEAPQPIQAAPANATAQPLPEDVKRLETKTANEERLRAYWEALAKLIGKDNILIPQGNFELPFKRNVAAMLNGASVREGNSSVCIDYSSKRGRLSRAVQKEIEITESSVVFHSKKSRSFDKDDAMRMALAAAQNPRLLREGITIQNADRVERMLLTLAIQEVNKTLPLDSQLRLTNPKKPLLLTSVLGGNPDLQKFANKNAPPLNAVANPQSVVPESAPAPTPAPPIDAEAIKLSLITEKLKKQGEEILRGADRHTKSIKTNEGDEVYSYGDDTTSNKIVYTLKGSDPVVLRLHENGAISYRHPEIFTTDDIGHSKYKAPEIDPQTVLLNNKIAKIQAGFEKQAITTLTSDHRLLKGTATTDGRPVYRSTGIANNSKTNTSYIMDGDNNPTVIERVEGDKVIWSHPDIKMAIPEVSAAMNKAATHGGNGSVAKPPVVDHHTAVAKDAARARSAVNGGGHKGPAAALSPTGPA